MVFDLREFKKYVETPGSRFAIVDKRTGEVYRDAEISIDEGKLSFKARVGLYGTDIECPPRGIELPARSIFLTGEIEAVCSFGFADTELKVVVMTAHPGT